MRLFAFIIFVCVILLATYSAPEIEPAPTPTEAVPNPSLPAPSVETYIYEAVGFALDYPAGWTADEAVIGNRGTKVQFLSSPEIAEMATLPEGATRLNATVYQ